MKKVLSILALVFLVALLSQAQENTGQIMGKVTLAEDGSPLPGVTVTLTGEVYGKSAFVTTAEGNFRFTKLAPGNYNLRFELQGFKTVDRTNLRVRVGATVPEYVAMEPGAIQEEITVVAQTAMIDTRKAQVAANYGRDAIQSLPIAMRTSEIINLAPGIMTAFATIAGQGSGTLHGFGVQNIRADYNLDGASFRATYGHGGMPTGVATDRIEEAQISTTGQDITNVQGGPTINFVSRRGGNKLAGDAYIAMLDRSLEDPHYLPAYMKNTLKYKVNSGLYRVFDYGAALGGPILKDHLWFFASAAFISSSIHDYQDKPYSPTYSPDLYAKLNFQWKTVTAELAYAHTDSQSVNNPFSSTILNSFYNYDRTYPGNTWAGNVAVTLWQKLLLTGKFTHFRVGGQEHQTGVVYTGTGEGTTYEDGRTLNPVGQFYTNNYFKSPPYNTEPTGHWQTYEKPQWRPYVVVEANYFAERLLGGDHELKLGFDMNWSRLLYLYLAPNQLFVDDITNVGNVLPLNAPSVGPGANYWGRARTFCDQNGERRSERKGIYIQDIMNYGRLTLNLGFRVDWHAWAWEDTEYHGLAPFDIPITELDQWTGPQTVTAGRLPLDPTFSPRVSLTFDLTGKGKDLVKVMFANYQGALDNLLWRSTFQKGKWRCEFWYPFIDYNGNYVPDWPTAKTPNAKNEFHLNDILGHWPTPDEVYNMIAVGQAEQKALEAIYGAGRVPWDAYTYPGWHLLSFSGNRLGKNNPAAQQATDFLAGDYSPDKVMEISLGYEKQITPDISLQVIGTYKKEYNFNWARGYYGTPSNYVLVPVDTVKGTGVDPTTGWQIYGADTTYKTPNGTVMMNYKHYYNYFKGLEFVFNKRFSRGWMLQASLDLLDWRVHYPETAIPATYTGPASTYTGTINPEGEFARQTLYDYYNKARASVFEYGSGEPLSQNPRWHFKISGLVHLPWDFNLSGFVDAREGYIYNNWVTNYLGSTLPKKGSKLGDFRLPNFWYANFTLDRVFRFSDTSQVKIFATGYNIFNNVKGQEVDRTFAPTDPQRYIQINRARIFQLGAKFSFR